MNRRQQYENAPRRNQPRSTWMNDDRNDAEPNLPEHDLEAQYSGNDEDYRMERGPRSDRNFYDQDRYGQRGGNISFGRRYENNDDYTQAAQSWSNSDRDYSRRSSPSRFTNNVGNGSSQGSQNFSNESNPRWSPYQQGRYAGVGPKGYTRSDNRLKEEICDELTRHADIDATDIEVEVKNGEVTLSGSVSERSMKHLAEDIADHCNGVKDVHNQIKTKKTDDTREDSTTGKSNSSKKSANQANTNH